MRSRVAAYFYPQARSKQAAAAMPLPPLDVDPRHLTLFDRILPVTTGSRRAEAPNIVPAYLFDDEQQQQHPE